MYKLWQPYRQRASERESILRGQLNTHNLVVSTHPSGIADQVKMPSFTTTCHYRWDFMRAGSIQTQQALGTKQQKSKEAGAGAACKQTQSVSQSVSHAGNETGSKLRHETHVAGNAIIHGSRRKGNSTQSISLSLSLSQLSFRPWNEAQPTTLQAPFATRRGRWWGCKHKFIRWVFTTSS